MPAVEVPVQVLKPGERADVVVKVNTSSFSGPREATLTVLFDRPRFAETQLSIHCFIRPNVLLTPGAVKLCTSQGKPAHGTATLRCVGKPDWRILRVESANPSISGQVKEVCARAARCSTI